MARMTWNPRFMDQLTVSPGVTAVVMQATEQIAAAARASAPVDTGAYRNGIITTSKRQRRIVGLVLATDPKSLIIEARTGNLVRALRSTSRGRRR